MSRHQAVLLFVTAVLWAGTVWAEHPVLGVLSNALTLLEKHGLSPQAESLQPIMLTTLARAVDPLGCWVDEAGRATMEDRFAGFAFDTGIHVRRADGGWRVSDVEPGSPAATAGLMPGDRILTVQGGAVASLKDWELQQLFRGRAEEKVRVGFARGGVTQEVELARARLRQPCIATAEDFPADIGYLRLNGLFEDAARVVVPALRAWDRPGCSGIVLDLRGAGGTNLAAAASVAELFAESGALLFSLRGHDQREIVSYRASALSTITTPMMVLVDQETEGAAEVLAAALASSGRRILLIGYPTRGDPCVRKFLPCAGGYFYLAVLRLTVGDGTVYDGRKGVTPDVEITGEEPSLDYEPATTRKGPPPKEEKEHRLLRERVRGDSVLHRAVDLLMALKALGLATAAPF